MTERYETPEDEGIPDLQNGSPEQYRTGDPQDEVSLTGDEPAALDDYGMTGDEMSEALEGRLRREQPDGPEEEDGPEEPAGRIVAPDEGAHADTEEDLVGDDFSQPGAGYTAEEAAMRVDDEG
jgi:hypothetical protein